MVANRQTVVPTLPQRTDLDPSAVWYSYDEFLDTLYVYFHGRKSRRSFLDVDDHAYLGIDPVTRVVNGLMVEHFVSAVLPLRPALRPVAALAGVPLPEEDDAQHGDDIDVDQALAIVFAELMPSHEQVLHRIAEIERS